jgi:hypothetical protein
MTRSNSAQHKNLSYLRLMLEIFLENPEIKEFLFEKLTEEDPSKASSKMY